MNLDSFFIPDDLQMDPSKEIMALENFIENLEKSLYTVALEGSTNDQDALNELSSKSKASFKKLIHGKKTKNNKEMEEASRELNEVSSSLKEEDKKADNEKDLKKKKKIKKIAAIIGATAAIAAITFGLYKLSKSVSNKAKNGSSTVDQINSEVSQVVREIQTTTNTPSTPSVAKSTSQSDEEYVWLKNGDSMIRVPKSSIRTTPTSTQNITSSSAGGTSSKVVYTNTTRRSESATRSTDQRSASTVERSTTQPQRTESASQRSLTPNLDKYKIQSNTSSTRPKPETKDESATLEKAVKGLKVLAFGSASKSNMQQYESTIKTLYEASVKEHPELSEDQKKFLKLSIEDAIYSNFNPIEFVNHPDYWKMEKRANEIGNTIERFYYNKTDYGHKTDDYLEEIKPVKGILSKILATYKDSHYGATLQSGFTIKGESNSHVNHAHVGYYMGDRK